jgi:hypothetical protein
VFPQPILVLFGIWFPPPSAKSGSCPHRFSFKSSDFGLALCYSVRSRSAALAIAAARPGIPIPTARFSHVHNLLLPRIFVSPALGLGS